MLVNHGLILEQAAEGTPPCRSVKLLIQQSCYSPIASCSLTMGKNERKKCMH